ncbi:MAG: TonB family protein [Pseudomonadota bacterium]
MELRRTHLLPATVVAVLLHGAVAVAVFWTPNRSGAVGAGSGGLEVSLGAAGGAPGAASPVDPGEVSEVETDTAEELPPEDPTTAEVPPPPEADPPTPVDETSPPDEVAETETTEVAAAQPTQPVEPPPPETTAVEAPTTAETILDESAEQVEVLEPETPTPVEVAPVEPPEPEEITVAAVDPVETVTAAEPTPAVVEAEPENPDAFAAPIPRVRPRDVPPPKETKRKVRRTEPKPQRQERPKPAAPKPVETKPRDEPVRQAARSGGDAAAETQDTRGQGNAGASGNSQSAGQGQRATAGGNPGAKRDYMSELAAILARHKRYPRRAQSRRQEGVGHLYFVVDASGAVGAMRLTKSTGHRLLDEEILAILGRVGRLPPIPEDVGVARLEIVVPVNFDLR